MKTLNEYVKKDLGCVSKWWKWAFIIWVTLEVIFLGSLSYLSYQPEEQNPDMKEIYFDCGNKIFFIGWFNE